MTFAPGDIVTLKSGGHSMTVVSIDADEVDCLWLGDTGELFRQLIPAVALTLLEQSDADEEPDDEDEADEDDEDEEDDEEHEEKRRA